MIKTVKIFINEDTEKWVTYEVGYKDVVSIDCNGTSLTVFFKNYSLSFVNMQFVIQRT